MIAWENLNIMVLWWNFFTCSPLKKGDNLLLGILKQMQYIDDLCEQKNYTVAWLRLEPLISFIGSVRRYLSLGLWVIKPLTYSAEFESILTPIELVDEPKYQPSKMWSHIPPKKLQKDLEIFNRLLAYIAEVHKRVDEKDVWYS